MGKKRQLLLLLAAVTAALSVLLTGLSGEWEQTPYYGVQLAAAARMQACMDAVKAYKAELGIPLCPEDIHGTGMLGEEFNLITTTLGDVAAKRSTANTDMAALAVRLLQEAGLEEGDTVGAGFSGSFPAMNLAVLCACDAMGLKIIYFSSVGSSMYGANNPGLTFPEMAYRLWQDGLISTAPACISTGGDEDMGSEMEAGMLAEILARLEALPLPFLKEPDYQANIAYRMELYESQGPIDAFVAVGGHISSLGRTESATSLGQGLISPRAGYSISRDSGLVERYSAAGLPVVNLLNIKKLLADYGLPFDPAQLPQMGSSAVYYHTSYKKGFAAAGLFLVSGLVLCYWRLGKKKPGKCN